MYEYWPVTKDTAGSMQTAPALGRPTLSFPLYQAFEVELHTSCTFTDGCFRHWDLLLLPSYTGWSLLFLALASLIYLPKEPAGAAIRAPSALDVPADWLEAFQSLVNSAYHSVFTFLVRVERIYSDSWLSSSLAARSSGRRQGGLRRRQGGQPGAAVLTVL